MDGRNSTPTDTRVAVDAFATAFGTTVPDAVNASTLHAAGAVVVALFDLADWRPHLAGAMALIDAEEAARATRQRNPRHRDDLLLAYALHRQLLAVLLDRHPADVPLSRDPKGCPRLPGDDVYTSLSHAAGRVAVACCRAGPVGIDIEPDLRAAEMDELVAHVAHPDECDALSRMPAHERGPALLRLWVRKEALLKAAGIGLEVEMPTFRAPTGTALPLPGDTFPGRTVVLRALQAGAGWTAALAGPPGAHVIHAA